MAKDKVPLLPLPVQNGHAIGHINLIQGGALCILKLFLRKHILDKKSEIFLVKVCSNKLICCQVNRSHSLVITFFIIISNYNFFFAPGEGYSFIY